LKVALLGDIHGNSPALAAVLAGARREGVTRLFVTGDFVGYYFWPVDVLRMLDGWDLVVVRGNHEDLLARARREPDFLQVIDEQYGTGTRVALETLSSGQLDWLENLPHPVEAEIDGQRLLLCHGAPWDVDQYIYPDASPDLLQRSAEGGYDWVVLGHTHYPMEKRIGRTTLVNPGSVGQPRNRTPGAQWAVLDTKLRSIALLTEAYDITSVVAEALVREPRKPYLREVLQRTR
jgi:putative phosphoesterase